MVIGKTDRWRWFEAGTSEAEQTEHGGGLGLDVVSDNTNRSEGPSDLTRKKTTTPG
jgi:hypothetical protein